MTRFLHFADVHLNSKTGGRFVKADKFIPYRAADILANFDRMIAKAKRYKVDYVFFAGDMYRDHLPTNTYRQLTTSRLVALAKTAHVIVVIGNHDSSKREHAFLELATLNHTNIHIVDRPSVLSFPDLQVVCIPWQFEPLTFEFELSNTKPNVAVAHCTIQEALFESGVDAAEVVLGRDFRLPLSYFDGFDYVALGHIHKQQQWGNVVYPGSMEHLTWGEFNDGSTHGFVLGEIGASWNLHKYKFRKRVDLKFNVDKPFKLPPVDPEAMYRITLTSTQPEVVLPTLAVTNHFRNAADVKIVEIKPRLKRQGTNLGELKSKSPTDILALYFKDTGTEFTPELKELWTEIQSATPD